MRTKFTKIHMIGIGGSGMSGIAEVLLNLGYEVHGSDMADGPVVQRLRSLGADIHIGHAAGNVDDVNVLVKSSAVAEDNPEVVAARQKGIPVIPRAEMLAELMRLRTGIAIAGTHGKTSTTSLTAAIFDAASLDPTVIIGGRINAYGANARLGQGEYLIAEADESDGSFLCLLPIINVVTNVDRDHLDHYGNQEAIDEAFVSFMNQIPFYGLNVVCGDDPGVERLLPRVKRPVVTYGFGSGNHIRAPSCGNRRDAGDGPYCLPGAPGCGGVSAAPFLADTGAVRRILSCARYGGQTVADGNLSRVGKAHPRRERAEPCAGHPAGVGRGRELFSEF